MLVDYCLDYSGRIYLANLLNLTYEQVERYDLNRRYRLLILRDENGYPIAGAIYGIGRKHYYLKHYCQYAQFVIFLIKKKKKKVKLYVEISKQNLDWFEYLKEEGFTFTYKGDDIVECWWHPS